jgi:hypothetical protein
LTEKAPFLITVTMSGGEPNPFNTYLVRKCVSMDDVINGFKRQGVNIESKNLNKEMLTTGYHYVVVDGPAEGKLIWRGQCRKLIKGEFYQRIIKEE